MTSDGFVFWDEPSDLEIEEGLSVVTGGGRGYEGERAFLCIQTQHANARALLTPVQLGMLIAWLSEIHTALAAGTEVTP